MFTSLKFSVFSKDANRTITEWERDMDHIYKTFADLGRALTEKLDSKSGEFIITEISDKMNSEIESLTNFPVKDANYNIKSDGKEYRLDVVKCTKTHKVD